MIRYDPNDAEQDCFAGAGPTSGPGRHISHTSSTPPADVNQEKYWPKTAAAEQDAVGSRHCARQHWQRPTCEVTVVWRAAWTCQSVVVLHYQPPICRS